MRFNNFKATRDDINNIYLALDLEEDNTTNILNKKFSKLNKVDIKSFRRITLV